jgi:hypothetical protein
MRRHNNVSSRNFAMYHRRFYGYAACHVAQLHTTAADDPAATRHEPPEATRHD